MTTVDDDEQDRRGMHIASMAAECVAIGRDATHWRESSDDYRRLLGLAGAKLAAAEARCAELEALASFGASLLSEWWENDCGDLDGAFVQDETEKYGLWHHVERHADGVECEWCCGEEPCGELTEAGSRALAGGGR